MEFRLIYEGPLPGQGAKAADKRKIRHAIHPQLVQLWEVAPLRHMKALLQYPPQPSETSIVVEKGPIKYAPLITTKLHAYAEIGVLLFRAQPRGHIITDGGDIDNRVKTLLDGLRIPRVPQEDPDAGSVEGLFHCLLEDDSLVTKISVETEQLLRPTTPEQVLAIIHVTIKKTAATYDNIGL